MKGEIFELKKSYAEWDQKFKNQASDFEVEKKKLNDRVTELLQNKTELEQYMEELSEEMNKNLEGTMARAEWFYSEMFYHQAALTSVLCPCSWFCADVTMGSDRIEMDLNPKRLLLRDSTALSLLRLDERIESVVVYIMHLHLAMGKINDELSLGEDLQQDLESLMDRLKAIPSRVQAWKKYAARCGADVALSLV